MSDPTTSTQTHLTWPEMERPPTPPPPPKSNLRIPAAQCAIFLGAIGVHKFVLGYTKQGVVMLLVTALRLGFGGAVMGLIGLVEGSSTSSSRTRSSRACT